MSINTTTLTAISSQIAFLQEKNKELNQAEIELKEQADDLITDLFFELGGEVALLKTETKQLTSSNVTLKLQLNQLKLEHIAETDSLLKNQQEQLNLVAKKIKFIVEEIQFFKKEKQYAFNESAILCLIKLQQDISEHSCTLSKNYPEEGNWKEENYMAKEQPLQVQQSESLSLIMKERVVNEKFRKYYEELQILKEEIYPLREAHEHLMNTQKDIVLLHQKDLKETHQACRDSATSHKV